MPRSKFSEAMTTAIQPNARAHVTRSALVTGVAQAYRVGVSFLSGIILARLLLPQDFGLVAMVTTCLAFVGLIQDLGLNQAVIQRERISHAQLSALYWISLVFSVVVALAFAASAPLIAWFFGDSRLIRLTLAFAFLIVLGGAQSLPFAVLNRELRFKALAAVDILGSTVSTTVGVAVAWMTSSYWALFAASLASALTSLVSVWIVCSFRPGKPSFEGGFRDIMKFGSGVSGFNIVNYFARNADNVLIGKFYGSEQLGYYDRAYRLLLFPISQILGPLGRVVLPLLARLQTDPERYRKAYIEAVSLLMMATQPGLVFSIVFAEDVFSTLFGPQWAAAVPIFQCLGVAGLSQVMTSTLGWLFLSQGRGGDFFRIGLFGALTTVASFVIGLPWGPLGVAIAYTINNYVVLVPASFWSSGRRGPVSTQNLVTAAIPHVIAVGVSAITMASIWRVVHLPSLLDCTALATLSYLVYGLVLLLFPGKREILSKNLKMLNRLLRFS
jgi:polysaccharide transporter, PST family